MAEGLFLRTVSPGVEGKHANIYEPPKSSGERAGHAGGAGVAVVCGGRLRSREASELWAEALTEQGGRLLACGLWQPPLAFYRITTLQPPYPEQGRGR